MPKGSKGWPIESDFRTGKRQFATQTLMALAAIEGLLAFSLLLIGWTNFNFALASLIAVLFVLYMSTAVVFLGGRCRFTPTSAMWVPTFGRPRWVLYAHVSRVVCAPGVLIFDVGKRIKIRQPKRDRQGAEDYARRELIRTWLDRQFILQPVDQRNRRIGAFTLLMVLWLSASPLVGFVFKTAFKFAPPSFGPWLFEHWGPSLLAGIATVYLMGSVAAFYLTKLAERGVAWLFGVTPLLTPNWCPRRGPWHGFEVLKQAKLQDIWD